MTEYEEKQRKRMYNKADWKRICEEVSTRITDDLRLHTVSTQDGLDVAVDRLETLVTVVLGEQVARARPSPYSKRWWTDKLTTLRHSLSAARNWHRRLYVYTEASRASHCVPVLEAGVEK
jgi:hypothetical protein